MNENDLKELRQAAENAEAIKEAWERLLISEEALQALSEKIKAFAEAIQEIFKTVSDVVQPILEAVIKIIQYYPNKRVKHLAAHGRPRTRKKNINRIIRWIMRKAHPNRKEAAEI